MFDTLDDVRADIDRRLAKAASDRRSPMHVPAVATADADVRAMVLRGWDAARRILRFHTDARSPKAATVGAGAPVGVLFYDKAEKIQLRCRGTGRIETGAAADGPWDAGDNFARRCYLGAGPGEELDAPGSGLPPEYEGVEPDDDALQPARTNFAVLLVRVERFDWLWLAHTGHRRAMIEGAQGRWVTP